MRPAAVAIAALAALVLAACGPGVVVLDAAAPSATPLPPGTNSYTCRCHLVVAPACRPAWCGELLTGTTTTPDGACDLGERATHACVPPLLNPASAEAPDGAHVPSAYELALDCVERVGPVVGVAARRIFGDGCTGPYGEGPCGLSWSCTAVRADGSVEAGHDAQCDAACPRVDLAQDDAGNWNLGAVTYVSGGNQWACPNEAPADTPRLCGHL